jgi:TatD DNase family protein
MFFDVHCHLDFDSFDLDRKQVVERARTAGVEPICAGNSLKANEKIIEFSRELCLKFYLGWDMDFLSGNETLEENLEFLRRNKENILGLGEIGLDFKQNPAPKELQEKVFLAQVELAAELKLPIVVHSRGAEERVFESLDSMNFEPPVVMHCFLKSKLAKEILSRENFFASLPTVKCRDRTKLIEELPLEKLLCETDSPFLWKEENETPVRNEPRNVLEVYSEISAIKGIAVSQVEETIERSVSRIFGIKYS